MGSCRVEPISILRRWLWSMRKSISARVSALGSCRSSDVSTTILILCWICTRKSRYLPVSAYAAAGRVRYPLPCSSLEIPGLLSLLSEGVSSAPPAAARPRQALLGHLSGEWSLNEALQTHPWEFITGQLWDRPHWPWHWFFR